MVRAVTTHLLNLNFQDKPSGWETAPGGKNCPTGGRAGRGAKQHRGNGWPHEESSTAGRAHSSIQHFLFVFQKKLLVVLNIWRIAIPNCHLSFLWKHATLLQACNTCDSIPSHLAGRAAEQWAGNRTLNCTEERKCSAATGEAEQRAKE